MASSKWYEVTDVGGNNIAGSHPQIPEQIPVLKDARDWVRSLNDIYPERQFYIYAATASRRLIQALVVRALA